MHVLLHVVPMCYSNNYMCYLHWSMPWNNWIHVFLLRLHINWNPPPNTFVQTTENYVLLPLFLYKQAKITFPTTPPVVAGNICHLFIYYSLLRALIVDLKRIHSVFPGGNSQICVGMRRAETASASVVHLEKVDSGEKKLCALEVVPHSGQWLWTSGQGYSKPLAVSAIN